MRYVPEYQFCSLTCLGQLIIYLVVLPGYENHIVLFDLNRRFVYCNSWSLRTQKPLLTNLHCIVLSLRYYNI